MDAVQSGASFHLLLLDLALVEEHIFSVFRWLRLAQPVLPVVAIGQDGGVSRRDELIALGARDCLTFPVTEVQFERSILQALQGQRESAGAPLTGENVEPLASGSCFLALGDSMRNFRAQLLQLAEADGPVFIVGESGSGKDTAARLIHASSRRSSFGFSKLSCAAVPEPILWRELFGHWRNDDSVFAEATPGQLERCRRGTLFLDDVTELPASLQMALLRVVREGKLTRPGTTQTMEVDVRILAAATASPDRPLSAGRLVPAFREYLAACRLRIPPLRERTDELPLLAHHLLHRLARRYGLPARELSPAILQAWSARSWPGNLREFEAAVKRYLIIGDAELRLAGIAAVDPPPPAAASELPCAVGEPPSLPPPAPVFGFKSLRALVRSVKSETEKSAVAMALERTHWNRKAAARMLRVSYRTLLYKIEQYQLRPSDPSVLALSDRIRSAKTASRTDRGPDAGR